MSDSNPGPAGWQPDPSGKHDHRYWDGSQWTDNVSDAGVASTDPYVATEATAAVDGAGEPPLGSTDPTSVDPVTPPATDPAAFGAGGPPPPTAVPPVTTGGDGDGSGGGSKKGLLIGGAILVIVAIIVAALALGGGDDDGDDDIRGDLVAALSDPDQGDLSQEDAECVADYLIDNVDSDVLEGLDFDDEDAPEAIQEELIDGVSECDAFPGGDDDDTTTTTDGSEDTTTTESDDTDGSTDGFSDGEIPDVVRDQIVQSLVQSGLSEEQAECVTDNIFDAVASGDITESDIFTRYQEFFEDCDVSAGDFGN